MSDKNEIEVTKKALEASPQKVAETTENEVATKIEAKTEEPATINGDSKVKDEVKTAEGLETRDKTEAKIDGSETKSTESKNETIEEGVSKTETEKSETEVKAEETNESSADFPVNKIRVSNSAIIKPHQSLITDNMFVKQEAKQ